MLPIFNFYDISIVFKTETLSTVVNPSPFPARKKGGAANKRLNHGQSAKQSTRPLLSGEEAGGVGLIRDLPPEKKGGIDRRDAAGAKAAGFKGIRSGGGSIPLGRRFQVFIKVSSLDSLFYAQATLFWSSSIFSLSHKFTNVSGNTPLVYANLSI